MKYFSLEEAQDLIPRIEKIFASILDIRGKAEWDAAEALYKAHPRKRFSFPEWGLWGIDDPAFVRKMADFIRTHPRLELAAYFSGSLGSVFDLAAKPRSERRSW